MPNNKTILMRHYDYISISILTIYVNKKVNKSESGRFSFCFQS